MHNFGCISWEALPISNLIGKIPEKVRAQRGGDHFRRHARLGVNHEKPPVSKQMRS